MNLFNQIGKQLKFRVELRESIDTTKGQAVGI